MSILENFPQVKAEINSFNSELPVDEASMPPASWYSDELFFKLDRQRVFSQSWQPVVRREEVSQLGHYKTGCLAGLPWIVVNDEQGQLHAFHNVCSHKGREVMTGSGQIKDNRLVCGYHAWEFDLQGGLKKAPQIAGIKNFDRNKMGLKPMALETWGNWIFINPNPNARPLKDSIGELSNRLEARNWMRLSFHSQKHWDINCNWKVYIDNYLDGGYHIPHMHPSLNSQLSMSSYKTECFETYSIQSSGATDVASGDLGYDPQQRIGAGSIYAWLFPNFMLNLYGNCLDTNWVIPIGKDKCRVYYEFYFLLDEDANFIKTSIEQSDLTQREDIEICESVQTGMDSGVYKDGRYAPMLEMGEYHFHCMLKKHYLQS